MTEQEREIRQLRHNNDQLMKENKRLRRLLLKIRENIDYIVGEVLGEEFDVERIDSAT